MTPKGMIKINVFISFQVWKTNQSRDALNTLMWNAHDRKSAWCLVLSAWSKKLMTPERMIKIPDKASGPAD